MIAAQKEQRREDEEAVEEVAAAATLRLPPYARMYHAARHTVAERGRHTELHVPLAPPDLTLEPFDQKFA